MTKKKCIFCKTTIKKFSSSEDAPQRYAHAKCWVKHRKFTDRYADHMFGAGKKLKNQIVNIKPTVDPSGN